MAANDQRSLRDRRKGDQADRTVAPVTHHASDLQRRLCLAQPAGPGDGYQPMVTHERRDRIELRLSPDEALERKRQVRTRHAWPRSDGNRSRPAHGSGTDGRPFELTPLLHVERQSASQKRERLVLWRAPVTTLECADTVDAHPGTLREGLLRESGG